ncbi:MAG TPA: hypothetical protein VGL93_23305 [Streptosporangiaceae bacterium]|jgi:hypothetical protein
MAGWIGWLIPLVVAAIAAWATLRARRRYKARLEMVDARSVAPSPVAVPSDPGSPPVTPADRLGVSLLELDVPDDPVEMGMTTDPPVLDVKVLNRGGETAVISEMAVEITWARRFAVLDRLTPYVDYSGFVALPPSATYEVGLPDPGGAAGTQVRRGISHTIAPGEADRIRVLLRTEFPRSATEVYLMPGAVSVYLLRLRLVHGSRGAELRTRPIGVACPGNRFYVPRADRLRTEIGEFEEKVQEVRRRLEEAMAYDKELRGRLPLDWAAAPPRREEFPDRIGDLRLTDLHDAFWIPDQAINAHLEKAEALCRDAAESLSPDMPDGLHQFIPLAHTQATEIAALREERRTQRPPDDDSPVEPSSP